MLGTPILPSLKMSPKYQNTGVFKFHCTIKFLYAYRITTSTANIGNLFENNLYILKQLKIMLRRMFAMSY